MSAHDLQQRLALVGADRLADSELVAVVLGRDIDEGARILVRAGGLHQLTRVGLGDLRRQLRACGPACRLHAAFELGRRIVDAPRDRGPPIRGPDDVHQRLRGRLVLCEREEVHVLGLDAHNRVMMEFTAALGTIHQVSVDPREIFRPLVRGGAHSAIVAHNHPSGDPTPSAADADLTARLRAAGELLGVPLLDHVVIAAGGYFAFSERGTVVTSEAATSP